MKELLLNLWTLITWPYVGIPLLGVIAFLIISNLIRKH